jgi:hypothetical protein
MTGFTPSTLARNNGSRLITISLDTSIKKLVTLTAHTLRGNWRTEGLLSGVAAVADPEVMFCLEMDRSGAAG